MFEQFSNNWVYMIFKYMALFWISYTHNFKVGAGHQQIENDKLNVEFKLVQDTETKCRGLMSFASVDDIFKSSKSDLNDDGSKENIVSLVDKCISQLDKTLVVPDKNVFTKLKFEEFNADKIQV